MNRTVNAPTNQDPWSHRVSQRAEAVIAALRSVLAPGQVTQLRSGGYSSYVFPGRPLDLFDFVREVEDGGRGRYTWIPNPIGLPRWAYATVDHGRSVDDAAIARRRWIVVRVVATWPGTRHAAAAVAEVAARVDDYFRERAYGPAVAVPEPSWRTTLLVPVDLPNDHESAAFCRWQLRQINNAFKTRRASVVPYTWPAASAVPLPVTPIPAREPHL